MVYNWVIKKLKIVLMKKFIPFILSILVFVGCSEKAEVSSINLKSNTNSMKASLIEFKDYIVMQNERSDGLLFDVLNSNEDIDVLFESEILDSDIVTELANRISIEMENVSGPDSYNAVVDVFDSDDIPTFFLFNCDCCLDRIRRNHCVTILPGCFDWCTWSFGSGC